MKTSVAVIGASGLVGGYLFSMLKKRESDKRPISVVGTQCGQSQRGLVHLDIADYEEVDDFLSTYLPKVIYLSAAVTNVDRCETDPQTHKLNVTSTKYILSLCKMRNIKPVFFSSGYVFSGEDNKLYAEDDLPMPINQYGQQKFIVENAVLSNPYGLVIRTMGVFGKEAARKNFAYSVSDNILLGKTVYVPDDQFMCPIHAAALSEIAIRTVDIGDTGIRHVNGDTTVSKYEFAQQLVREFRLDASKLVGVSSSKLRQVAKRPKYSTLENSRPFDFSYMVNLRQGIGRMAYERFG